MDEPLTFIVDIDWHRFQVEQVTKGQRAKRSCGRESYRFGWRGNKNQRRAPQSRLERVGMFGRVELHG